ncbi:MAG TPA: YrdB family protein [Gemmatimonadaceae bacterium]
MAALRVINLGVRFLLELAALAIFGYWGATLAAGVVLRTTAAVVLPLAVAVCWGIFISPKARVPTGRLGRAGLGLLVFLAAAAALYTRGHVAPAATFAVVAVASSVILYILPQ